MSEEKCPFCDAEIEKADGDWREWACGTQYSEYDMHDQSTYCLRVCFERAEAQIAALKDRSAKLLAQRDKLASDYFKHRERLEADKAALKAEVERLRELVKEGGTDEGDG